MKSTFFPICSFFAVTMLVFSLHGAELKPTDKIDIGSGASSNIKFWYPGGIDGRWLAVGNPNKFNRNDKVVFRFPLALFIAVGKVQKAELHFRLKASKKNSRPENIMLEHFTKDRRELTGQALISHDVEDVGALPTLEIGKTVTVKIDVTKYVNKDLAKGYSFINFRLTSLTAEKYGVPENGRHNYASLIKNSVKLDVKP